MLSAPASSAVALSQDGATYAYCPPGRRVQLYSTATGRTEELRREAPYSTAICAAGQRLVLSADGRRLIHTAVGRTSTLWDVPSRTAVREFTAASVEALSPDGALAVEVTETQFKVRDDKDTSSSAFLLGFPRLDTDGRAINLSLAFDADSRCCGTCPGTARCVPWT
ncbi:hypothetical protein [Streptomyces sp. NPDC090022]|uniref:hypothetical protein n=1 Tax=Streptomyces sp. NPDC090022 TaxID=3365920 RepID=UPI003828083C